MSPSLMFRFGAVDGLLIRMPGYPQNKHWEDAMLGTVEWASKKFNNGDYATCKQLFDDVASAYGQYIRIQDNATLSDPR